MNLPLLFSVDRPSCVVANGACSESAIPRPIANRREKRAKKMTANAKMRKTAIEGFTRKHRGTEELTQVAAFFKCMLCASMPL
jgi:hypothetical protein